MPSELSGGQRRRMAIARAFASKPRHLLIDDPTSGLDPITSKTIDNVIVKLRDLEHVTSIVVTHQIPDAQCISSREAVRQKGRVAIVSAHPQKAEEAEFIMLADAKVYFESTFASLRGSTDPYLTKFMS
jgi:ABC-type transporter Mla maintaining outer membrane lipid asymmetry ATPase subunit MlaF